jgi:hypothetical protein
MKKIFLVGAQKAGTSYLHNLLALDSRVATFPDKEPHFFSSRIHQGRTHESLFPVGATTEALLDSSVSYLHHASVAQRIFEAYGETAIIVAMIRRPEERAISAYLHSAKNGRDTRSADILAAMEGADYEAVFAEENRKIHKGIADGDIILRPEYEGFHGDMKYEDPLFNLRYVSNSFYERQLQAFQVRFPCVLVFAFDTLLRRPEVIVSQILNCAGIDPSGFQPSQVSKNETEINRRIVCRKYLRNVAYSPLGPLSKLRRVLRAFRIIGREYDASRILRSIKTAKWVDEASKQYTRLTDSVCG